MTRNILKGLMASAVLAVLLAPTTMAAPSVVTSMAYNVSEGQQIDCAGCSWTIHQSIIQTKYYPCPPGQVGGYYEVTVTVTATVYIDGNPYTVTISKTLHKTGACVGGANVQPCSIADPTFRTDSFDFANNVYSASATGVLASPDSNTMASKGDFALSGYDREGNLLGTWQFHCL